MFYNLCTKIYSMYQKNHKIYSFSQSITISDKMMGYLPILYSIGSLIFNNQINGSTIFGILHQFQFHF
ncbi:unnamed protein product [Paramecium sonneborni]|uniref:Uncharacterized protein n=1 Tax=Paramecium sonneborni TaxID=65129 RepID=A0A8S1QB87_9CILI|nr:unnamed protein product [Paramecium sonneborni]